METRSAKRRRLSLLQDGTGDHGASSGLLTRRRQISDLPDDVLCHILSFLPIKSVARTSLVSKRWAALWRSLPDLDFTTIESSDRVISAIEKLIMSHGLKLEFPQGFLKFLYIVNPEQDFIRQVLKHRSRSTQPGDGLRLLRFCAFLSFTRLNNLMRDAFRHKVNALDIEVATKDFFNLPKRVVTSEHLQAFRFVSRFPGFRLPPLSTMKNGFRSLRKLHLSGVILNNQPFLLDLFTESSFPALQKLSLSKCFGLEKISIKCGALESVVVKNCSKMNFLEVRCPKLERLRVSGCFPRGRHKSVLNIYAPRLDVLDWEGSDVPDHCCLHNSSPTVRVSLGFLNIKVEDIHEKPARSLLRFLSGISHARSLRMDSLSIKILGNMDGLEVLQPFKNLAHLELSTFTGRVYIPPLVSLFMNASFVECLHINLVPDHNTHKNQLNGNSAHLWDVSVSEEEKQWEIRRKAIGSFLDHLKVGKITGLLDCEEEVSLTKFLLRHGKSLNKMILCLEARKVKDSTLKQIRSRIVEFSKAASNAKISFC
ncbi:putative F-box/FBD/LRR-repeat protein At4g03220 isoform X1 [Syzygium oleosum]|uniref:putative F-box/FBD/LRR-repeat protein At4g03220 isoform X1 n=1 Tax=Syzygium oleosum TaxID=219896 RepID=UPI0024BB5E94|nr:putative F-box/FBD/LRR-repeat protein At4g03220 isoform X1 [Syzygium oleosum]